MAVLFEGFPSGLAQLARRATEREA